MTYGTPYWWEDGAALPDLSNIPPHKAEVLIIGAGYTGLSAALTAQRAGAKVVVVDAALPGQGASTRNGGMAGAHPRLGLAAMSNSFGAEVAVRLFNEAAPAFAHLRHLLHSAAIDCDFQETGRIQMAFTRAQFAAQKAMAADMNAKTAYKVQVVERGDLGRHIQTDQYFGGLFFADHAALHPRKFQDGLLAACLREGVQIIQNCPIWDVTQGGGGFQARWAQGTIAADKILLATNGYARGNGVFHWIKRRVFPLPSFIIATEPLPRDLIARLAPGRRMMVETRARHSYFRISPDGRRILWGGRAAMTPIDPARAARRLHATMAEVWPELTAVNISHSWRGNTGFTFSNSPCVGMHAGMHYAFGYCGGGVVLAPYLGMKAAYQMLGDVRGETAYAETPLQTRTWHPGGPPLFLKPGEIWYRHMVDRRETAAARRDHQ